jgi:DNA-binding beta-propeller fold protein YncE
MLCGPQGAKGGAFVGNPAMADRRIAYEASSAIRDVISTIGRTEDIKLSPDNTRLALADFQNNSVLVFSIRIDPTPPIPRIAILDHGRIPSARLNRPHGLAFLGPDHLLVCNRAADAVLFRLPPAGGDWSDRNFEPLASISGSGMLFAKVKSPGSVASYPVEPQSHRVLICNNYWHFVSSHLITIADSVRVRNHGVLIEADLQIPDGISCSTDHAWIAVSNHVRGEVLVYRNTPDLNRRTPPAAVLRGLVCPHGVRFAPDGRRVFAADAASQYFHIFESASGQWHGIQDPKQSIRLFDDDTFYLGRYDSREGGIKGIDVDASTTVLVTTRTHDPVAFYSLAALQADRSAVDPDEVAALRDQRDRSLQNQRSDVLNQRWTLKARVGHLLLAPRRLSWRLRRMLGDTKRLLRLHLRNRWSRETLLDPSGPVLSLTTHGRRLRGVFYAIESIGLGSRKPRRIMLWLDDEKTFFDLPPHLQRLRERGLEINLSGNFGPHTKYYPYIEQENEFRDPLVTADDDMIYPPDWLRLLIDAHEVNPVAIHCHRAHRMNMSNGRFMPYKDWDPCVGVSPSHLNFLTGVSGVIYPPEFLQHLKRQGRSFEDCCAMNDDIWLTVNALRGGFKIAQVRNLSVLFPSIPGSQTGTQRLYEVNVLAGGNQIQLARTFSASDLAELRKHLSSENGELP